MRGWVNWRTLLREGGRALQEKPGWCPSVSRSPWGGGRGDEGCRELVQASSRVSLWDGGKPFFFFIVVKYA